MSDKTTRIHAQQREIHRLDGRIAGLEQINTRYTWARLATFLIGAAASFGAFFAWGLGPFLIVLALATAAFVTVVLFHRRLEHSIRRHVAWRDFTIAQIARSTHDWSAIPPSTTAPPRYDHPFEADLDLVGEYSVHRLINIAVSVPGSVRLHALLADERPDAAGTAARQALVGELRPRILLRKRLAVAARSAVGADEAWEPAALQSWLGRKPEPGPGPSRWGLALLVGLAVINLGALALSFLWGIVPRAWMVTLPVYALSYYTLARNNPAVFKEASHLQDALRQLADVFQVIESYDYSATPALANLCRDFQDGEQRPSRALRRISRVVDATGVQGNPFIWVLLNLAVPWDYFFALRLVDLKADIAEFMPGWLATWFELEALGSLANLGYLNPDYVLPDVTTDANQPPVFAAHALGHPLLPDEAKVTNHFAIDQLGDLTLITGSNMAGKSTFLRTVGVNLILAYAGAPVDATQMTTTLFRPYTCIKVSDSVTGGISYFYAEVQRLRGLLDALDAEDPLPLFFLIDEIFRGTNNTERLQGSRAYIRRLVGRNGVGLISTHDLELVKLGDEFVQVNNFHFRDDVADGRMVFDYLLRAGPCPTTNALKIMALEGLPVE